VSSSSARRRFWVALVALSSWASWAGSCRPARAADPLNSSNRASTPPHEDKTDANIVPVVGGTTDIGFGAGEFSSLTRLHAGADPYLWQLESAGLVTFKPGIGGGVQVPYQDFFMKLTVPRLFGSATRLEIRPEYSWEATLGYYGLGNASTDVRPSGATDSYFFYGRVHPTIDATLHWRVVDHLAARTGLRYTQNWIQVAAGTRLAQDLDAGSSEVKGLLGSTRSHGVALFTYGIEWDNRDNAVAPHRGLFTEGAISLSPGGTPEYPYRYGQGTIIARGFVPLGSKRLTLAVRGVADAFFGDPPFYEMARFDDTYALGGPNGVRGIPAQRYYGKAKVFGNVEVRGDVTSFHALGKKLLFGLVAFADGGRVWADYTPHPELDGTGVGLKYGVGGGARLQSGAHFILRADVAWSPDARPIGGYFSADQAF
jgi:outer membrane protein assembly factor BamA